MRLSELEVGKDAVIVKVNAEGITRRRLYDLGFIPGTRVHNVRKSPAGNPVAYSIRDTLISLRKEEADTISINLF